jgi:hypothetical protein
MGLEECIAGLASLAEVSLEEDLWWLREVSLRGDARYGWTPTHLQPADPLTKQLPHAQNLLAQCAAEGKVPLTTVYSGTNVPP